MPEVRQCVTTVKPALRLTERKTPVSDAGLGTIASADTEGVDRRAAPRWHVVRRLRTGHHSSSVSLLGGT